MDMACTVDSRRYSPSPISTIGEVGLSEPDSFSTVIAKALATTLLRHRVVHHDGVAVLVGLEDAGRHGGAFVGMIHSS